MSVELITLGTAAGPAIRGPENGMSSALVVGDAFYMVDFGLGCSRAAHEAGLRGKDFVAGFVTHLHSDHVVELPGFLLWNWGNPVEGFTGPVSVVGPGKDHTRDGGARLSSTSELVSHSLKAFSYDIDIRVHDEARPELASLLRTVDLITPRHGAPEAARPFDVYEDDRVKVTGILVEHPPVRPALAFRFDTDAGSVVYSGDTAECDTLAVLATSADVLVHEAVNLDFYAGKGFSPEFLNHQRIAHTPPEGAGRVATAAGVGRLVLSHLAGRAEPEWWRSRAASSFDGPVDVAVSGQRFTIGSPVLAPL
ncbi:MULTISPECIES: MBL fold metallo-hydrolase [unclassified Arthrobacter]|uniref:MBL fold metallo-hydrolase n=1 Tax=unclassified Arthrobacter TaxID=235627 RepID=UPI002119CEC5|nr:MBL fold metallo-hydrolase [Arthrobacter sp. STN4]MCQ9165926.1 MBL fold metallo-hydrolase [Arthrobacter sp. STN4]